MNLDGTFLGLVAAIIPGPKEFSPSPWDNGFMKSRILIVEDDDSIADFLGITLSSRGFLVERAADGNTAVRLFKETTPDAVLLDLNLPGLDGNEVLRVIRQTSDVPVLVVSVRDEEFDKVRALELGADDYVTKPFSARELVARVKTNLRRQIKVDTENFELGDLLINWKRAEIFRNDIRVILSNQEFDFLHLLFENRDRVLTRSYLVERVWGYDFEGDERVVDTTVKRLRRKIGPTVIETVRGKGYRLLVP